MEYKLKENEKMIETHGHAFLLYRMPESISSFIAGYKSAMTQNSSFNNSPQ